MDVARGHRVADPVQLEAGGPRAPGGLRTAGQQGIEVGDAAVGGLGRQCVEEFFDRQGPVFDDDLVGQPLRNGAGELVLESCLEAIAARLDCQTGSDRWI